MKSYVILFALAASISATSACQAKVDPSKILRPVNKCPSGLKTVQGEHGKTCCCADGCCWDNCRLDEAPEGKCVDVSVNGEYSTTWTYDGGNKFWVLLAGPKSKLIPKKPASGCPDGTFSHWSTALKDQTCCYDDGCCWDKCNTNSHKLKGMKAEWVRNSAKAFWVAQLTQEPRHCLPHQQCQSGDCCSLGTSCKTCPNGSSVNNQECSGKGNYRCNLR